MVRYSSTGRERNEKECKDDVERDKMNQTQFYPLMKKIRRLIMRKKELKSAFILSLKERAT